MDECSPTHPFPSLHLHQHQSFHVVLPNHHNSETGYTEPALPLQHCQGDDCFSALDTSSQQREGSNGGERGLLGACDSSLDGGVNMGGHLEGEDRASWYSSIQKEDWDDSVESPTDDFYLKGHCYRNTNDFFYNENRSGHRGKSNYSSCSQLSEIALNRKPNSSYVTKQAHFCRGAGQGSNHSSLDYSRTDSVLSHGHSDRGEFGCCGGSGADQLQPEADTSPWLNDPSFSQTGENRWRGESHVLAPSVTPQKTPVGLNSRTYTQKLDSFSEAFLSQGKRRFPVITTGDSHGQMWDNGIRPRLSCSFDSDSSSPSLPSFPSPSSSNLLSPPPTPLPPASYSPSKMDSPGGPSLNSQGVEGVGALQFFPVRPQSLHSTNSSGMIWKFPLLSHCFPQLSVDSNSIEGNPRSSLGSSSTGPPDFVQSVELVPSSSPIPVLHSSKALCFSNGPSLNSFFHPVSHLAHTSNHKNEENIVPLKQKIRKGPTSLRASQVQEPVYTGTTFPSILQSKSRQKQARYTPQPLLNPLRRGTGLFSSICHKADTCGEEEEERGILPCVNVGPTFQADVPPCSFRDGGDMWSSEEEDQPREQLLWKPWEELTNSNLSQNKVEKLLIMSSSSCLPGGGTNTELALHCLYHCQGDIMATLEMLLFSQPMPAGDYHYPGSDVWTDNEKRLFSAALETHSKDFFLIHTMVKTKTVAQCVEFYYLSKRLQDKQKSHKTEEESKVEEAEQLKKETPMSQPISRQMQLQEVVPVPSMASFFPCKLCGKMFYKIKSRNAHMKIHRQPQEDWTDKKLQQQILNQALNRAPSLIVPPQTLTFAGRNNTNISSVTNTNSINLSNASVLDHSTLVAFRDCASHVVSHMETVDPSSRETTGVLQFQPLWGSFGQASDPSSFYCSTDVKTEADSGTETDKWK